MGSESRLFLKINFLSRSSRDFCDDVGKIPNRILVFQKFLGNQMRTNPGEGIVALRVTQTRLLPQSARISLCRAQKNAQRDHHENPSLDTNEKNSWALENLVACVRILRATYMHLFLTISKIESDSLSNLNPFRLRSYCIQPLTTEKSNSTQDQQLHLLFNHPINYFPLCLLSPPPMSIPKAISKTSNLPKMKLPTRSSNNVSFRLRCNGLERHEML